MVVEQASTHSKVRDQQRPSRPPCGRL